MNSWVVVCFFKTQVLRLLLLRFLKEKQTRAAPAAKVKKPTRSGGGNLLPFRNFTGQSFGWPVSVLPETNFEFCTVLVRLRVVLSYQSDQ